METADLDEILRGPPWDRDFSEPAHAAEWRRIFVLELEAEQVAQVELAFREPGKVGTRNSDCIAFGLGEFFERQTNENLSTGIEFAPLGFDGETQRLLAPGGFFDR